MSLSNEIKNVQNPALCGYLLSVFTNEYYVHSNKFPPLQLLFVVYPLILKKELCSIIDSTNRPTGLRGCMDKLKEKGKLENDFLLHIQSIIIDNREHIFRCICIAINSMLISTDEKGIIIPLEANINKIKVPSKDIEKLKKAAAKLGTWFSELSLVEIEQILKVRF